jgi:hypothetical protein
VEILGEEYFFSHVHLHRKFPLQPAFIPEGA